MNRLASLAEPERSLYLTEEPTVVLPERPHRRLGERIRSTAAENLPIAQLVCAVATTLAAMLYVASALR